jgi:septum formation topological specificity factor MinE
MAKKITLIFILMLAIALVAGIVGAQDNPGRGGPGGRGERGGREGVINIGLRELGQIVSQETGLDGAALMEELRAGKTLAEIITANEGDVEAVVDTAITQLTERINQAVANERLTQERADELLANLETAITDVINGTVELGQNGEGMHGGAGRERGLVNKVAESAGLEPQEVIQQVRDGATLGSILTEAGVDVATFVDEQAATAKERLDQQVANGRISQAVADARLNLMRVELLDALNRTRPATPAEAPAQPGL